MRKYFVVEESDNGMKYSYLLDSSTDDYETASRYAENHISETIQSLMDEDCPGVTDEGWTFRIEDISDSKFDELYVSYPVFFL